jgi:hypothetical protein
MDLVVNLLAFKMPLPIWLYELLIKIPIPKWQKLVGSEKRLLDVGSLSLRLLRAY